MYTSYNLYIIAICLKIIIEFTCMDVKKRTTNMSANTGTSDFMSVKYTASEVENANNSTSELAN